MQEIEFEPMSMHGRNKTVNQIYKKIRDRYEYPYISYCENKRYHELGAHEKAEQAFQDQMRSALRNSLVIGLVGLIFIALGVLGLDAIGNHEPLGFLAFCSFLIGPVALFLSFACLADDRQKRKKRTGFDHYQSKYLQECTPVKVKTAPNQAWQDTGYTCEKLDLKTELEDLMGDVNMRAHFQRLLDLEHILNIRIAQEVDMYTPMNLAMHTKIQPLLVQASHYHEMNTKEKDRLQKSITNLIQEYETALQVQDVELAEHPIQQSLSA